MIKTKQTSKRDAVNDDIIYKMYASVLWRIISKK